MALATVMGLSGCGGDEESPGPVLRYTAIGDSYSSGIGIGETQSTCGRSKQNYPSLYARAHPGTRLTDVTCAGAAPENLTRSQSFDDGAALPQLDAVTDSTDLVTYSLGANQDLVFGTIAYQCIPLAQADPRGAPCSTARGTDLPAQLLGKLAARTRDAVAQIQAKAPSARVVVVGYPEVFSATSSCPAMPLATGDVGWVHGLNQAWNDGLARGAQDAGVEFLDVAALSQGHDLCSDDPWVNPIGGSYGPAPAPEDGAPVHPRPMEHEAVAEALAELTSTPAGGR